MLYCINYYGLFYGKVEYIFGLFTQTRPRREGPWSNPDPVLLKVRFNAVFLWIRTISTAGGAILLGRIYWVTQKLPQISTVILRIRIWKVA